MLGGGRLPVQAGGLGPPVCETDGETVNTFYLRRVWLPLAGCGH